MGQGFLIVNKTKKEYLDALMLPSNFKDVINSPVAGKILLRLMCISENDAYISVKKSTIYSEKYMGSWSGDEIVIMGDYQEEAETKDVLANGKNIFPEVMAMVYDQEDEELHSIIDSAAQSINDFIHICQIALLPDCPKKILHALESKFGTQWKEKYYKELKTDRIGGNS